MKLSDFDGPKIQDLLSELKAEATGFVRNCDANAPILSEFKVYMRYAGQGWEIPIVLTEDQAMTPDAATFEARFEEDYVKLFGRKVTGLDIEITVWSVNATTPPEKVAQIALAQPSGDAPIAGRRQMFDPAKSGYQDAAVVLRDQMAEGVEVAGPAAVTEDETTIIIPSSRKAIRQPDGCIDVSVKG